MTAAIGCKTDSTVSAPEIAVAHLSEHEALREAQKLLLSQSILKARDILNDLDYSTLSQSDKQNYFHLSEECNYFVKDRYIDVDTVLLEASEALTIQGPHQYLHQYRHNFTYTQQGRDSIRLLDQNSTLYHAGLYQIGKYFTTIEFDIDSTFYYFEQVVSHTPPHDIYHMEALRWMSILGIVNRENLASKRYVTELNNIVNQQYPDHPILNCRSQYLGGYVFWRNGDTTAVKMSMDALQKKNPKICTKELQEAYKYAIYVSAYSGDSLQQKILIDDMKSLVNQCGDYGNYNKQIGEYHLNRNEYDLAIIYLEKALAYVASEKCFNDLQFGSLVFNLFHAYLDSDRYSDAFDLAYSADLESEFKEILPWDPTHTLDPKTTSTFYYFMTLGYYIEVYLNRYNAHHNIEDLYAISALMETTDSLIQKEYFTLDEQVLLTINDYSSSIYKDALHASVQLYQLTQDSKHLNDVFKWSNKNKSKILRRDQALLNKNSNFKNDLRREKELRKKIIVHGMENFNADSLLFYQEQLKKLTHQYAHTYESTLVSIDSLQSLMNGNSQWIDQTLIDGYILIQLVIERDTAYLTVDTLLDQTLNKITNHNLSNRKTHLQKAEIFSDISLKEKIVFSKDAALHKINYSAMIDSDEAPLVINHNISYTSSLLGLTDHSDTIIINNAAGIFYSAQETIGDLNDDLPELAGNIIEANTLESHFPQATLSTGRSCTAKNFEQSLTKELDLLYLGLHGQGSATDVTDLELYFRDGQSNIDTLKAYELLSFNTMPKVVVLSACESAKGINQVGEGYYDIARYFISAGSQYVISSIEELDDVAAQNISKYFLSGIANGLDIDVAFHQAQKKIAQSKTTDFDWAAMVIYQ